MNNKRQTIWLVSMLSLMVILSAYYLFTEDVSTPTGNASGINETYDPSDATKASGTNADGVEYSEVDVITGETTGAATDGGSATGGAVASADDGSALSPEDEAVIKNLNNQKGSAYLDQIQLSRKEQVDQKAFELESIISDNKNASPEEARSATEQLAQLEERDARISSLEDKLLQQFDNAVVQEEDVNNYKVIVLSDKLEKKQAVGIVELATKELQTTPDRVSVQAVPQE